MSGHRPWDEIRRPTLTEAWHAAEGELPPGWALLGVGRLSMVRADIADGLRRILADAGEEADEFLALATSPQGTLIGGRGLTPAAAMLDLANELRDPNRPPAD